jgi:DNA-binding PadR family transcriptional regulator
MRIKAKLKYYFKKPRSEIGKDILYALFVAGAITIALSSPYFGRNLLKAFKKWIKSRKYQKPKKVYTVFYRLLRSGYIITEKRNHDLYIHLTEKGKRAAGWLQIDALKIKRPKKWDGKYRLVIFDISQLKRIYRDALRGKLRELGFIKIQKSVWLCPFDCRDEIALLREFFGLSEKEMRLIIAEDIGDDKWIRKIFKI